MASRSNTWTRCASGGVALIAVASLVGQAPTAVAKSDGGGRREAILEVNLTNSADRKDGEPTIAINPKNPDNLIATYASFKPNQLVGTDVYNCHVAYSFDRGATWTEVEKWPNTSPSQLPQCGELNSEVDDDGNFYVAFNNLISSGDFWTDFVGDLFLAKSLVTRSTDGGRTWSDPVSTSNICGIVKMRVDPTNGKIYNTVAPFFLFPMQMTVGDRDLRNWSKPVLQPGAQYAVHDGILMVGSNYPSVQVNVSTDDAKTFTTRPVTDSDGVAVASGSNGLEDPSPWVTADPTRKGRFAVLVPRDKRFRFQGLAQPFDSYEVYVTGNSGRSWTGPAKVDAPSSILPWIEFGSGGELGIAWRAIDEDDMVDAYSVMSFDHGRTFSAPLKVNAEKHPWGDAGPPADDWSGISIDRRYAYVTWADQRTGGTADAIMARVPLTAYERP